MTPAGGPREVCERHGVAPVPPDPGSKAGVARAVATGAWPLHGLRHPPAHGTSGWYVWTGDLSDADGFFEPVHVSHLAEVRPEAVPYLALPPGWRFLLAPGHEDVWHDASLLRVRD